MTNGDTYACKADFVAEVVEASNAVLSILEVVVLDEAEAVMRQYKGPGIRLVRLNLPLAKIGLDIND